MLRISGVGAIEIADAICKLPSGKKLSNVQTHTISYGWVIDENKNNIDQVLFLVMHGPHTFTGQDTVEITCHNNPFITEQIIAQTIKAGARLAKKGEFTKRAVLNNKIDLIQAEAINELIHAQTQHALKQSLSQLEGSFSHWIGLIEKDLIKALAFCQASFEFIDEEDMAFGKQIKQIITKNINTIKTIKKTFDQQQQIRQGIKIAIIGSVNAGKSSLFNALLNKERAIVTNIAGTTRDSIEAGVYTNGNYWTLIDTAGLRTTDDLVEKHGIERSLCEAKKADIILLVSDGAAQQTLQEKEVYNQLIENYEEKIISVHTKVDLTSKEKDQLNSSTSVSSKTKQNIDALIKKIEEKIAALFKKIKSPFLLNQRQFNLLLSLKNKLNDILPMLNDNIQYELVAVHLNDALSHASELTGKEISEQGMDAVFREFCVGK